MQEMMGGVDSTPSAWLAGVESVWKKDEKFRFSKVKKKKEIILNHLSIIYMKEYISDNIVGWCKKGDGGPEMEK